MSDLLYKILFLCYNSCMKKYTKPKLKKLKGKDKEQARVTYEYAQFCSIVKKMTSNMFDQYGYPK